MQTFRQKFGIFLLVACVFCIGLIYFIYFIEPGTRWTTNPINPEYGHRYSKSLVMNPSSPKDVSTNSKSLALNPSSPEDGNTHSKPLAISPASPEYTHSKSLATYTPNYEDGYTKSFRQTFLDFPWDDFEKAASKNVTQTLLSYSQMLIDELSDFLEIEPFTPVNPECLPPTLPSSAEINCAIYPKAFTGVKRTEPVKIATLLQFGFDVDVLEIHLNELYGVVDKFFIIESTHAHYGKLKKPLMWEQVKHQERFKKFPVVHFIIDDAESSKATDKQWSMESLQERLRWQKFLEWNAVTQYFNDNDIIGFGDADEIPNRSKLNMFKYCEIREKSVDFGIWFPFGHINQAFRSDHPVPSHPYTLGDPTYYTLASAKKLDTGKPNEFPTRKRGKSGNFILGGIHMTHYGYLPYQIVKYITATEGGIRTLQHLQTLSVYLKEGDIKGMEVFLAATPKMYVRRITQVNLTNPEMKEICLLPWFYDCNRERYPVWEDKHDTRLD